MPAKNMLQKKFKNVELLVIYSYSKLTLLEPAIQSKISTWSAVNLKKTERLPFVNKTRKFRLEIQMVQLIPPESFRKRWKSSDVFLFSRSNRNDRKIRVPFANSHLTRFASAPFPAFRHCRYGRHFDLLLFSSSRERLGPGESPDQENPVPLRAFHSNRIFRANGTRPR